MRLRVRAIRARPRATRGDNDVSDLAAALMVAIRTPRAQVESEAQSAPATYQRPGAWPTRLERDDMAKTTAEKLCKGCGQAKPRSEFHRNRAGSDGLQSRCKACSTAAARAWRAADPQRAAQTSQRSRERRAAERPAESDASGVKRCKTCDQIKPADAFSFERFSHLGRKASCKRCLAAKARAARRNDPERARRAARRYSERHAEREKRDRDRRRRASLEKYAARERVRRAVQAGRLVRPDRCEGCELSVPVQAHHDDYSKPLEVRWLCPACHVAIHVRERDCG